ncbi:MAG: glycosyltransferase family 39 protein, partial [Bacteroidota bacterium]
MRLPETVSTYLAAWLLLNLVQSASTELIHDEAYYWYFSKNLAWGYFDHPPAIAAFIKPGYWLFQNELGVRMLVVLAGVATIWLMHKITGGKDVRLLFSMVLGAAILHVGGFIAVPDVPLVLFTALFFYFFKSYLEKTSWRTAIWLTLCVTGMAYSKYQSALVVIFAMLPNLHLLRRPSFWLIPILTAALLLPHLFWQWEHDFQTFRYQFLDRSNVPYKFEFFTNYLLGQLLIFGPLLGLLLFPAAVKFKARDRFERTLKWCFYGFFGFFLLQSLKSRVEPNWTVMGAVPLFYLAYHFIENRENWRRWAFRLSAWGLALILVFRLYAAWDFLPQGWVKRNEFHGWEQWAKDIERAAGDLPVVFQNTFQKPSKYMFYTGKFAHTADVVDYAGKQYDLDIAAEESLQGKTVFRIHGGGKDSLLAGGMLTRYDIVPAFHYFNRIKIQFPENRLQVPSDTMLQLPIQLENPTAHDVDFSRFNDPDLSVQYCLFWYGKVKYCQPAMDSFPVKMLKAGERVNCTATIRTPPDDGKHWQFRLAIYA